MPDVDAKKVLLIEDEPDIRENLQVLLADEGYTVQTAVNGQDALDLLRSTPQLPALILLDLMMPGMSGNEFLERLEHEPHERAHIPIVVLTAAKNLALARAVAARVDKPFNIDTLLGHVARYCR